MTERKLATIREVSGVTPIGGADFIVSYQIDGWSVTDKKGAYSVGDNVVYLEVDSFVPHDLAPFLAQGKEPSNFNGVEGTRLRTKKMKGVYSQGLILPLSVMGDEYYKDRSARGLSNCWVKQVNGKTVGANAEVGSDVTAYLGIQKWEAPENKFVAGNQKGNFPSFIPKTDQERIQNVKKELAKRLNEKGCITFQVTEKLHGSSMTIFNKSGEFGVCSRNYELKLDDESSFTKCVAAHNLKDKLLNQQGEYPYEIAIQGELCGSGMNGNQYGINGYKFYVFDVFSIVNGKYLETFDAFGICKILGLDHVPVVDFKTIHNGTDLDGWIKEQIAGADGGSVLNNSRREGLVYKDISSDFSFKVISNAWLLKNE